MKPGDTLAQGQAQAGSAVLAASGFIRHIESLRHPVQIFLWDSMTVIRHPEEYPPVFTTGSDTDPAAFVNCVKSVIDQIHQKTFHQGGIHPHGKILTFH